MAGRSGSTMGTGWTVSVDDRDTIRDLERIQRFDIPEAKSQALRRAVDAAIGQASSEIADSLGIPRWMIRGVGAKGGSKGSGSRIARTGYIKSRDGVIVRLLHKHINPVGTNRKKNKVYARKRVKGVKVAGRTYENAWFKPTPYGGHIYTRTGPGTMKSEVISLDPVAEQILRRTIGRVVPPLFKARFEHELQRRLDRRVARAEARAGAAVASRPQATGV